jgi:hypothetical protein
MREHANREPVADDCVRNRNPVQPGELVVEERDVGLMPFDRRERSAAVIRLGYHLDLTTARERADDSLAGERVVVGDDDADLLPGGLFSSRTLALLRGESPHSGRVSQGRPVRDRLGAGSEGPVIAAEERHRPHLRVRPTGRLPLSQLARILRGR